AGRLLAVADTIERRLRFSATRIEKLPQAILSRAFSGELVPTEAELARADGRDYETAEQLLRRIKVDQAGAADGGGTSQHRKARPARRSSRSSRRTPQL